MRAWTAACCPACAAARLPGTGAHPASSAPRCRRRHGRGGRKQACKHASKQASKQAARASHAHRQRVEPVCSAAARLDCRQQQVAAGGAWRRARAGAAGVVPPAMPALQLRQQRQCRQHLQQAPLQAGSCSCGCSCKHALPACSVRRYSPSGGPMLRHGGRKVQAAAPQAQHEWHGASGKGARCLSTNAAAPPTRWPSSRHHQPSAAAAATRPPPSRPPPCTQLAPLPPHPCFSSMPSYCPASPAAAISSCTALRVALEP